MKRGTVVRASPEARLPAPPGGFLPLRDYAVIGNQRTGALVRLDGAIDWLPLPAFNGPSAFAAVLDPERGGRATLAPEGAFTARIT